MSELHLDQLITVDQAIDLIDQTPIDPPSIVRKAVEQISPGDVLADDVHADRDYPPFDKSLVDGFAARSIDLSTGVATLKRVGEVAAGATFSSTLGSGECVAIMTGAPIPAGADVSIPIEDTTARDDVVVVHRTSSSRFITRRASEAVAGQLLLGRGSSISMGAIGVLAQVGRSAVDVFESPVPVGLLVTGDELVPTGVTPVGSQIRDANGPMLSMLLRSLGCSVALGRAVDQFDDIAGQIERLAGSHRVAFVTGGMSMGRYDFVPAALKRLGFELKITKLRIKPGKPFVFATRVVDGRRQFVFGLPGNPVSGFCCTLRLASRLIDRLRGSTPSDRLIDMPLSVDVPANGPREFYQPARIRSGRLEPLDWKGSADVFTLSTADALIVRPANAGSARAGELTRAMILPR
jgi:molybdopterin molybdotransferase